MTFIEGFRRCRPKDIEHHKVVRVFVFNQVFRARLAHTRPGLFIPAFRDPSPSRGVPDSSHPEGCRPDVKAIVREKNTVCLHPLARALAGCIHVLDASSYNFPSVMTINEVAQALISGECEVYDSDSGYQTACPIKVLTQDPSQDINSCKPRCEVSGLDDSPSAG